MIYQILITPTALRDLQFAADYYEQNATGLGQKFNETIEVFFDKIAANPFSSAIRYNHIRCKPVIHFPYLIMYNVDEQNETVQILRVFNTYQEPLW
jgi:toxin ParE1/3/4